MPHQTLFMIRIQLRDQWCYKFNTRGINKVAFQKAHYGYAFQDLCI